MVYQSDNLNQSSSIQEFANDAEEFETANQKNCWDERDGFYYCVDLNLRPVIDQPDHAFGKTLLIHAEYPQDYDGLIQRIEVWSGFMSMWGGYSGTG